MRLFIFFLLALVTETGSAAAQSRSGFDDSTAATSAVTRRYIDDYFSHHIDNLAAMMHPDISFEDPTAAFIFSGGRFAGKENVVANFRSMFRTVRQMTPTYIRTIISSNTAVFELTLDWDFMSVRGKNIHITTPLVVVMSVRDGTVVEHRDYGDYSGFLKEYRRQND